MTQEDHGVGPGDLIAGRYLLERLLGKGGMGSVWRAADRQLSSPVAVKIIRPKVAENRNSRARFLREAKAAAMLRSPHVVQVIAHGEEAERIFIVMEMLEGESLLSRLKRERRLDPLTTATMLTHVGRAMTRAHEAGIVHRDLKPDNIFLVDNDGELLAKVLDFGIAKSHLDVLNLTGESPQTQTGALLGTPYYMSPEQATASKDVDHRADIWAMGVIAYECLLGRRPYVSKNLGDLVLNICSRPQPVPSTVGAVPRGFDAWFARAQARNPDERFQSARELVRALREVLIGPDANTVASAGALSGVPLIGPVTVEAGPANVASSAPEVVDASSGRPSQSLAHPEAEGRETLDALAATHGGRRPSWVVGAVAGSLFLVVGAAIAWALVGTSRMHPAAEMSAPASPRDTAGVSEAVDAEAEAPASALPSPSATATPSAPVASASVSTPRPPAVRPIPAPPAPPPPPVVAPPPSPPDDPLGI